MAENIKWKSAVAGLPEKIKIPSNLGWDLDKISEYILGNFGEYESFDYVLPM